MSVYAGILSSFVTIEVNLYGTVNVFGNHLVDGGLNFGCGSVSWSVVVAG